MSCPSYWYFCKAVSHPNPRTIMSDEDVSMLPKVLRSHKEKLPKILLQRAEKIFPSLNESTVSVVCMKCFYELVV
jgi:hypothetical protein